MNARTFRRPTVGLMLAAVAVAALVLSGCRMLTEEFRAFGIFDDYVANQDAARIAIQAIAADTLPEDDEYFVGRVAAAQILSSYPVYRDEAATSYINLLGQTLAIGSDRPVLYAGYRFLILDTDEINGLATPGGHIFVTRGLLRLAQSEDEVAAILAHEISHVVNRHGAKAIMETRGRNLALRVEALNYRLASVGMQQSALAAAVKVVEERSLKVANSLLGDGYSVDSEIEADLGAIQILLRLGYDPYALVRVLDRYRALERQVRGTRTGYYQTHPNPVRRIREINRRLRGYGGMTTVDRAVLDRRYRAALANI